MTPKVGQVQHSQNAQHNKHVARSEYIIVKQGNTIEGLAKEFGMSVAEFKEWAGLEKNTLTAGQRINLPTAKAIAGKGLYAIAREYGMTMAEFAKLNNIKEPSEYKVSKDEVFYIKRNRTQSQKAKNTTKAKKVENPKSNQGNIKTEQAKQSNNSKKTQESHRSTDYAAAEAGAKIGAVVGKVVENKQKWGSSYTPEELGEKIYELSEKYWGAVGKPDFDALLKEINPKNASAVIEAYTKNPKNEDKESLIYTILREVKSKSTARKEAAIAVYDALAKEKNAPDTKREEFLQELENQFDSWGLVSTKKLDKIIEDVMKLPSVSSSQPAKTGGSGNVDNSAQKQKVVTVPKNGKPVTFTAGDLQRGAINSAKKEARENFKAYCKENGIKYDESLLDYGAISRIPLPTINGTTIVAKQQVFKPTGKDNGKVIIINPGHGGYSSRTGYYDPGSYSFIKKGNGKYAPLLEADKMKIYGDDAVQRLRAQGYTVVLTNAHAQTMSDQSSISNIVRDLKNGKHGKKYKDNEVMFISLHADSEPGQKGSGVCYDSRFENDRRLASVLQSNLNEAPWVKAGLSERNWDVPKKGLQVLHQTETIPSVLLEVEYVNGSRSQNLDSSEYQRQFLEKMVEGINEYFGV